MPTETVVETLPSAEGETAPQGLLLIHSRLNICCLPRGTYLFLLAGFQRFQFFFHSVKFAVHLG